jgi:hypothetical protein
MKKLFGAQIVFFMLAFSVLGTVSNTSQATEDAQRVTTILFDPNIHEIGDNEIVNKKYDLMLAPAIVVEKDGAKYFASTQDQEAMGITQGRYLFLMGSVRFIPTDTLTLRGHFRPTSIFTVYNSSLINEYGRAFTLIPTPAEYEDKILDSQEDVDGYVKDVMEAIKVAANDDEQRGNFPSLKVFVRESMPLPFSKAPPHYFTFTVNSRGAKLAEKKLAPEDWNVEGENDISIGISANNVCFMVNSVNIGCVPHLDKRRQYSSLLITGLDGQRDGLTKVSVTEFPAQNGIAKENDPES